MCIVPIMIIIFVVEGADALDIIVDVYTYTCHNYGLISMPCLYILYYLF